MTATLPLPREQALSLPVMAGLEPVETQGFTVWTQDRETSFISHVPYCACTGVCHPTGLVPLVTLTLVHVEAAMLCKMLLGKHLFSRGSKQRNGCSSADAA